MTWSVSLKITSPDCAYGLKMGVGQAGKRSVLLSKLAQLMDRTAHLLAQHAQCVTVEDEIGVIGDIAGSCSPIRYVISFKVVRLNMPDGFLNAHCVDVGCR